MTSGHQAQERVDVIRAVLNRAFPATAHGLLPNEVDDAIRAWESHIPRDAPSAHQLATELDEALHGTSWPRPISPAKTWASPLNEVRAAVPSRTYFACGWRLIGSDGKVRLSSDAERPSQWGGRGHRIYVRNGDPGDVGAEPESAAHISREPSAPSDDEIEAAARVIDSEIGGAGGLDIDNARIIARAALVAAYERRAREQRSPR